MIAFDSETYLIQPGLLAPRGVCISWATENPKLETGLVLREEGLRLLRGWLYSNETLVGHNLPFDLGVACADDPSLLPLVFAAYAAGKLACTIIRQQVLDVALGMRKWRRDEGRVTRASYGLDDLTTLYFNERVDKTNPWRLRFGELDGVPVDQWPVEASSYAIGDAIATLRLYSAQSEVMQLQFNEELPDQAPQQRAAWALHLMSMWGLRADEKNVERFVEHCQKEITKMELALADTGILRRNSDGSLSKVMKEIQRRVSESLTRLQLEVPVTEKQMQPRTDGDTLRLTDDRSLHALAESMSFSKHLGQWGPVLRAAVRRPVCVRYTVLMENGRTSSSGGEGQEGTNIQNPPRKGEVRPCIRPRDGWVLCSTDADTIELRALAQCCVEMVGYSRMAETLREQAISGGPDLHVVLGANILGISATEAHTLHKDDDTNFANTRQLAKHVNFALAGGAGAEKFSLMAHGFGICLTESFVTAADAAAKIHGDLSEVCPVFVDKPDGSVETKWVSIDAEIRRAAQLREVWFLTWPEMKQYFRKVGDQVRQGNTVRHPGSGRLRGDCRFTAAANGFFSGRVADAMKEILFHLAWECYVGTRYDDHKQPSPLSGSRPIMFLHDEPILEHPMIGHLPDRCARQQEIVVQILEKWMPAIPCSSTAVVMRRWYKSAKPVKSNPYAPVRPMKIIDSKTGANRIEWVLDND